MKVLITGGAGFIGSHIVDNLVEQGIPVVVVDNLSTGNLENIPEDSTFYNVDIMNEEIDDIVQIERPSHIIHQAAQVSVGLSLKDPVLDAQTNTLGTIRLLKAAQRWQVEKVVYASSAAVYGEPEYLGINEKHPIRPFSPYGISKYTGELYLSSGCFPDVNYTILRYANVYGPRQDHSGEGGVVAIFAHKLRCNQSPSIYGDGNQTRDFVYVKDVASANLAALSHGDREVFNIGTGTPTTVNELHRVIASFTEKSGRQCTPIFESERAGDIRNSFFSIEKARNNLNWEPHFTLLSGLEDYLVG